MDIDVFDDNGKSIRNKMGHLVAKKPAPSMTRGFWKEPERYIKTYWSKWPNIWYHGDWASVDKDGFWYLHGRSDDTIKIAGRRTGPAEIEAALIEHPAVSEAATIGVPDEIITRMEQAETAKDEGVKIILEIIEQLEEIPGVHGIHIMAVGWEDIVPEMVEQAGLMPRPIL